MTAGPGPAPAPPAPPRIGVVAIGRNEGRRLARCLASLRGARVVYVDSGSTDDSLAVARAAGVEVVQLDMAAPFTAARARNAGFAALMAGDPPDCVQFVDGDCAVEPGWLEAAAAALAADPGLGIVTGWRREIAPTASIYNAMAEWEWHRPAGDVAVCGGDMMLRCADFARLSGFDAALICSEDEELCLRVRAMGRRVHRLPRTMTWHDADMTRLGQWWRRAVRAGHGFAEVGRRYPDHVRAERRRMWAYGAGLPALALAGVLAGQWALPALAALGLAANWARSARNLRRDGVGAAAARRQAVLLVLSKFANLQGALIFHARRLRGHEMRLIEYK
ncbi:glycosyltransferase [Limimaricola pyoseonensis]|uniref:Glycosyltransferase, GT2 family n=1 Tax=Limimaricola pyoseonensis TaxID=521013 RepID=A0A1G7K1Y9_9RHOB|nr:glycosyltransferase [Limimaricola pyoseonensis]SDF31155.1 Glycosyltransferase, GT2 family [Limimaricola pyoseonensis]